ncbi:alpha/beta hydrolase [Sphingobacterium detergens]|nr:alpha/beta hydrolase [Sphingobacterium detergens]
MMDLDEISQNFLSQMKEFGAIPFHKCTAKQARIIYDSNSSGQAEDPVMKSIRKESIPVLGGEIDVFIIDPSKKAVSIIVLFHGGGWVVGKASAYLSYATYLSEITHSIVAVVDYRKAPEYPHPVPANDAYQAVRWVDKNMESIAGGRLPLIVCGESAGGNLAAVTVLKAKELGGPKIACQILVCPVMGDDFENNTYNTYGHQLIISKKDMIWFWDQYVPDPSKRKEPYVSPIYAEDLKGLPKTVLITAGHDPLRQEGEDYAGKLIKAGVSVTFKRFEDQMHGFFTWVDFSPVSRAVQQLIGSVILNEVVGDNSTK